MQRTVRIETVENGYLISDDIYDEETGSKSDRFVIQTDDETVHQAIDYRNLLYKIIDIFGMNDSPRFSINVVAVDENEKVIE